MREVYEALKGTLREAGYNFHTDYMILTVGLAEGLITRAEYVDLTAWCGLRVEYAPVADDLKHLLSLKHSI